MQSVVARVCHDLITPVSAISNGIELLQEESSMESEVQRLISNASRRTLDILRCYRAAWGQGDTYFGQVEELQDLLRDVFENDRIRLVCDVRKIPESGGTALLMSSALLCRESLSCGGVLQIAGGARELTVESRGSRARIPARILRILNDRAHADTKDISLLSALYARFLADSFHWKLHAASFVEGNVEGLRLRARLAPPAPDDRSRLQTPAALQKSEDQ